jgi:gamma-glutamyltranspeptidase/glutathione hydrolase
MRHLKSFAAVPSFLAFTVALLAAASAQERPASIPRVEPVIARHGMVVAQEALAARIGARILEAGGNAVDAAVATGFALAVTYPRAGNLGGGGFMAVHLAKGARDITIDYRETAPAATTPTVFLDEKGEADPKKSRESGLAIGVPGTVAGLTLAHAKYGSGKFTLAQLIAPAARLAREGIAIEGDIADTIGAAHDLFARWPSSAKIFLKPDGSALAPGDILVQRDLADTLDAIAHEGPRAFYGSPIAEKIATAVREVGGLMTVEDLKSYRAVERKPVRSSYRGYTIISMPPPSSGGVHLIEMLNILEGFPLRKLGAGSLETLHLMIEAMKRAYADRAVYLGDPDFVRVPVRGLTSKRYAAHLRAAIDRERATPSSDIRAGRLPREGDNTTHFSVVDRFGNAVSNTYTLNLGYGLGLVAEGTGVLLNNELDDFAAKPGAANAYGLVGGGANAPGPRKRPLSSMSPTIVLKGGKPLFVTGTPGGSRIITTVLQIILNTLDHRMSIAGAVAAPRIHHQWLPDEVLIEPGIAEQTLRALEKRGHTIKVALPPGSANSIMVTPQGFVGAADTRTRGALAAGF